MNSAMYRDLCRKIDLLCAEIADTRKLLAQDLQTELDVDQPDDETKVDTVGDITGEVIIPPSPSSPWLASTVAGTALEVGKAALLAKLAGNKNS